MNFKRLLFPVVMICFFAVHSYGASGELMLQNQITIYTSPAANDPLGIAIQALQRDIKKVTGLESEIKPLSAIDESGIVILNNAKEEGMGSGVTGWEAHRVYVKTMNKHQQVVLEGADLRGAIFAVYTFSEKVLGVPPLWYFSSWKPNKRNVLKIPSSIDFNYASPDVKYRAWFPNDTDLFQPWRRLAEDHYELWLEMAMRLKLNTIEWFDDERDYAKPYSVSRTTKLINNYGLLNTTHHHSPLNASFAGWDDYWKKTRHMKPPELSLKNTDKLMEFWRYNIKSIVKNNIQMLWVLGFRGNGDHPFWYTFKDAPESMQERGKVISEMMEKQRQLVMDVTKDPNTRFRTIFYDELSDLLAKGYIAPPADSSFIWTYVAARRDHYPNKDIQQLSKERNLNLGYYFNYQFTSTGSHLAAAEGPWKMEKNYRYVNSKSDKPIAFSVVNAGNLREHLLELSANAEMMWDFDSYHSDEYLNQFCRQYYGQQQASKAARLYKDFYHSYWQQRQPDMPGFNRQYIFQDLRYNRALKDIATNFNKPYTTDPLIEISAEQVKNRTYNIVPADNRTETVIDAIIKGTSGSSKAFHKVARQADKLYKKLAGADKAFFNDNLRQQAYYMYHLNQSLLKLSMAYKAKDKGKRKAIAMDAMASLKAAEKSLLATQHGNFDKWYAGDRVFGFKNVYNKMQEAIEGI